MICIEWHEVNEVSHDETMPYQLDKHYDRVGIDRHLIWVFIIRLVY